MKIETVKVKHDEFPDGILINKSDLTEDHVLFEEKQQDKKAAPSWPVVNKTAQTK